MEFLQNLKELFLYNAKNPLLFNSGSFLVLFIVFLILYTIIAKRRFVHTLWVILFSFFFYYKSSGWYFVIPLAASLIDWGLARWIYNTKSETNKKLLVIFAIIFNLGLLAYFKYTNFIFGNFYEIMGRNFQPLDIFLPIGISFHTFQSISYILDVYWKKIEPCENLLDYTFFLTFFPQLVAGPIVKANHFLPQLKKDITVTKEQLYTGIWLIMLGLLKKVVIADYIAQYNDLVFASPDTYSGFENLMAIYGYTLQIYCDFSGYSDMAIGLALTMGFDFGINFNFPYKSLNITDFWRRWHISLSSWLREYLYIPLGGNKKGKIRTYINLMLTMLIGGLWHGANWKFVFWGALHGIGLAIHKACKKVLDKIPNNFASNFVSWFITFHFVIFLWIFFRATDIKKDVVVTEVVNGTEQEVVKTETTDAFVVSWQMVERVFTNFDGLADKEKIAATDSVSNSESAVYEEFVKNNPIKVEQDKSIIVHFIRVRYVWFILMIIGFAMHASPIKWNEAIKQAYIKSPYVLKIIFFIIVVQLVIQFRNQDIQPFIYFQF